MTAPLKGGVIEGGKIAGKKAIEQLVVREAGKIAANVAVRAASEIVADQVSGGSRGGHVSRSSGKKGGRLSNGLLTLYTANNVVFHNFLGLQYFI